MRMPKVSIVVPVYNVGRWLRRCIESIQSQSFDDFELLLINDGSKDNSGEICDEYAGKDTRIRVFHKQNGGASSARNFGLDNSRGEWVTFIDADDYISENYLSSVVKASTDIVILESKRINGVEIKTFTKLPESKSTDYNSYKHILESYIRRAIMKVPWGKLIRRECIGNLRFNVGQPIGEDALFMYDLFARCTSIEIFNGYVYYWQEDTMPDNIKYKLSADKATEYAGLIYNSYRRLDIESNDLEQFLVNYFFSLCDKKNYRNLTCWFENPTIKTLERNAFRGSLPMEYVCWKRFPLITLQYYRLMNICRTVKNKFLHG